MRNGKKGFVRHFAHHRKPSQSDEVLIDETRHKKFS